MRFLRRFRGACLFWLVLVSASPLCVASEQTDGRGENVELVAGWGWLVLDMVVERPVSSLEYTSDRYFRGHDLGAFEPGRVLQVIPFKKGAYQWHEIGLPHYDLPFQTNVSDDERWRFNVESGAMNYIGRIIVDERRGTDYVDIRFVNRLAMSYPEIQEKLKSYVEQYPLVYSGPGRDDFLKEYRKRLKEDGTNEAK